MFNLLGVFSCHSKRYRNQFTLPEDYLCRVQYRSAKVGSAKIQQAAHILPGSIFFLNPSCALSEEQQWTIKTHPIQAFKQ